MGGTYDVLSRVAVRQRAASLGSLDFELGHHDDDSDVFREPVADMTTDVPRRLRRQLVAGLRRARVRRVRRQHLCERDRGGGELGRLEHAEERAGEAAAEGCGDVVRVSLDHEGVVLDALLRQLQVAERVAKKNTCDDGGCGRAHAATEGDLVVNLDRDAGGGEGQAVREQDVEGDAGDQVLVRVGRSVGRAFAGVGEDDLALRLGARRQRDAEG